MSSPPQDNDPSITEFVPSNGQWQLTDEEIQHIDPQTGETILHNYCKYSQSTPLEVFRYLIETKGCDINALDNKKHTPLYFMIHLFRRDFCLVVLRYLLSQRGLDVRTKDNYDSTLLHWACRNINSLPTEVFTCLIETHGADLRIQEGRTHCTPLCYAFQFFNPDLSDASLLIYLLNQRGVDVNFKNIGGQTLLHLACLNINSVPLEVLSYLIEVKGADLSVLDAVNNTPVYYALKHFRPDSNGDAPKLLYLFHQKGIDARNKNHQGCTLLHEICLNVNKLPLDVFKVLIETHGADLNAQENYNDTPLHYQFQLFEQNYPPNPISLAFLLNRGGVNVNIKGRMGRTLLHWACLNSNLVPLNIFQLLIETNAANLNIKDDLDNTPLYYAIQRIQSNPDEITVVTYLLGQKSLCLTSGCYQGWTLLHQACRGHLKACFNRGRHQIDIVCNDETQIDSFRSEILEMIIQTFIQQLFLPVTLWIA